MKTTALLLALSSLALRLEAKPTLKTSDAIDEKVLADSLKKATAKMAAKDSLKPAAAKDTSKAAAPAATAPAAKPSAAPAAKTAVIVAPTLAKAVDSAAKALAPAAGASKPAGAPSGAAGTGATAATGAAAAAATGTPLVPPAPVVRPPVTPPLPNPKPADSVVAKRYKVLDRPLNRDEIKYFLSALQMGDTEKTVFSGGNWSVHDKQGAALTYASGASELAYNNPKTAFLTEKDRVPDSLIHTQSDALLRGLLKDKAERYFFANYEITMVQRKEGDGQGKISDPEPAFYYGRYIRKLDNRLILGDAFQIRVGFGAQGAVESFSFRDPVVAEGGEVKVPSREIVMDSLKRWERSKTHTRAYVYPFHPDHLNIKSLKAIKTFDSYVLTQEKFRDAPNMSGTYLVPVVTVLAQVLVSPPRQKPSQPVPTEPQLLHFHFPCHPDAGLCWPDGNRDLQGALIPGGRAVSPAKTDTAAKAPAKPKAATAPAK